MDFLSKLLTNSGIGCFIGNVCFNHVFYADDLCLMAPCPIHLSNFGIGFTSKSFKVVITEN